MDEKKPSWYYRPWFVLIMLFFVLGPLGLPLVYKSPCFSKPWKIILTIVMIVFTVYLVVTTYELVMLILEKMESLGVI